MVAQLFDQNLCVVKFCKGYPIWEISGVVLTFPAYTCSSKCGFFPKRISKCLETRQITRSLLKKRERRKKFNSVSRNDTRFCLLNLYITLAPISFSRKTCYILCESVFRCLMVETWRPGVYKTLAITWIAFFEKIKATTQSAQPTIFCWFAAISFVKSLNFVATSSSQAIKTYSGVLVGFNAARLWWVLVKLSKVSCKN